MADWVDYDEWSAEADDAAGPQVRLAGREWTLPARHQVSAKAVADFQRLRARMAQVMRDADLDDADDVPPEVESELVDGMDSLTPAGLLRMLIGDTADEMLDAGASHGALERLARDYSVYVEQGRGPLANGQAPANRQERRSKSKAKGGGSASTTSQSTGSSSKPTSSASTDST